MEKLFNNIETDFATWATALYTEGWGRNVGLEKEALRECFLKSHPQYRQQIGMKQFRSLLLLFCRHHNLQFNPHRQGFADWRDKSNGQEYYLLADTNFDAGEIFRFKTIEL